MKDVLLSASLVMQRGQFLAELRPVADHPLLQGEGRGEDGFVPRLFNTHPHLNPPLEGEDAYFQSWRKKSAVALVMRRAITAKNARNAERI